MKHATTTAAPAWAIALLFLLLCALGCEPPSGRRLSPRTQTFAELRVVRRGVEITSPGEAGHAPASRERLVDGATIDVAEGGLAWLRRDAGATVLVSGPARLRSLRDALEIERGRVFVDAPGAEPTQVRAGGTALELSRVRASLEVAEGGAIATYVLEGEVRTGASSVRARAGEELVVPAGGKGPEVRRVTAWEDWTGGLATTDRAAAPPPFGVGTVGARPAGDLGAPRSALIIQSLDLRVSIVGDLAITEVEQQFFNPASETVEGIYRMRLPRGASLERFGVDRLGAIAWGWVKEKAAAAAQYQSHVYRGSTEDPALLAWVEPGVFEAKLYPLPPGASRRVVTRWTEWLPRTGARGERRLYVFPMAAEGAEASLPLVEELTATIDVLRAGAREIRTGMDGVRVGDAIVIRRADFVPRADLAIELLDDGEPAVRAVRAPHRLDDTAIAPADRGRVGAHGGAEADYLLVPLRPAAVKEPDGGLDLAIVVDASAGTDDVELALARASVGSLLTHLGAADRVAVFAADDRLRPALAGAGDLRAPDAEHRRAVLAALAQLTPGGATDLGAVLAEASARLDPARRAAVVYVGDGAPTVGERTLAELRARLAKAPRPVRIFALATGDGADLHLLEGIAQGGFAARVTDGATAARVALSLLEQAERPALLRTTIDLGAGVERVYPRDLSALAADESILLVGRIAGEPPKDAVIRSSAGETRIPIAVEARPDRGDLRRRWAELRLAEMLEEGAGRAALVDLGVRQGIVTPVTSMYVPTTTEMTPAELADLRARAANGELARRDAQQAQVRDQAARGASVDDGESDDAPTSGGKRKSKGDEGGFFDGLLKSGDRATAAAPASPQATAAAATDAPAPESAPKPARNEPSPTPAQAENDKVLEELKQEAEKAPAPIALAAPTTTEAQGASPPAAASPAEAPPADEIGASGGVPAGTGTGQGYGAGLGRLGGSHRERPDEPPPPPQVPSAAASAAADPLGGEQPALQRAQASRAIDGQPLDDRLLDGRLLDGKDVDTRTISGRVSKNAAGPIVVDVSVAIGDRLHRHRFPCSGAADAPLAERIGLWRERLARAGASPQAVANVYRGALARCEARSPRERLLLLGMLLDALPTPPQRVALWRIMQRDLGAADVLYRGLLTRVRTADEARALAAALGLRTAPLEALEAALKDADGPAARVAKLRALARTWPDDHDLALRLLDALEDAGDASGARAHGRALRRRPDVDARVRTAVGELHLRLAARAESPETKSADEQEARRAFGEIVEFAPDDPAARRRLGDLLRAHGWFEEAARQYETLAALVPDDPGVAILRATAAEGRGLLEEAVKWADLGVASGPPDATTGPSATARALAATVLARGKVAAQAEGDADLAERLAARRTKYLRPRGAGEPARSRVAMTWAHPDLHPSLWSDTLGAPMPATEGDPTLGIAQVDASARPGAYVEVRIDPAEAPRAARLGAEVELLFVVDEGEAGERVVRRKLTFARGGPARLRFDVATGEPVAIPASEEAAR